MNNNQNDKHTDKQPNPQKPDHDKKAEPEKEVAQTKPIINSIS